jgi:hypothetical protein
MLANCSLVILHACSVWALFAPARPNYTVPTVISWASLGIYFQPDQPVNLIMDTFDSTSILTIQYLAGVICLLVVILIMIRFTVAFYKTVLPK